MLEERHSPEGIGDPNFRLRGNCSTYWFNKASDLRGGAAALWASMSDSRSRSIVEELKLGSGYRMAVAVGPVYLMLCGLSLELLLKSILVAKGVKREATHDLPKLAKQAGFKIDDRLQETLAILSHSARWYGRYPIPIESRDDSELQALLIRHSFDRVAQGQFEILRQNSALSWESFEKIWSQFMTNYPNHPVT